jgi:hypothetical protein
MTKQQLIDSIKEIEELCESAYLDCNGPEHEDFYVLSKKLEQITDITKLALQDNHKK